jgi:hypothetical protein
MTLTPAVASPGGGTRQSCTCSAVEHLGVAAGRVSQAARRGMAVLPMRPEPRDPVSAEFDVVRAP